MRRAKSTWWCFECGMASPNSRRSVVVFEAKSTWQETQETYICAPCLRKALKLIEEEKP